MSAVHDMVGEYDTDEMGGHGTVVGRWAMGEVQVSALILLRYEVSNLHSPIFTFLICDMESDLSFHLLSLL